MRRYDHDLSAGLGDAIHFPHSAQDILLMFKKVGEINPVRTVRLNRPRKMAKLTTNVCAGTFLAVEPDGPGFLFVRSASEVED